MLSMSKKQCICKEENAWYNDFGVIKYQYCMGIITDKERLKRIEEYNTSTNRSKYEY